METVRKQFAANLRQHRDRAGLSQEALADLCDLHRTEISLLERCKRSPRLETIVILARGLELQLAGGAARGHRLRRAAPGRHAAVADRGLRPLCTALRTGRPQRRGVRMLSARPT